MFWIYDLLYEELKKILAERQLSHYSPAQVFSWVYQKQVLEIDRWTNISRVHREILKKILDVQLNRVVDIMRDHQGTTKLLISLKDGRKIESVLIREKNHLTFCLSSQVGCPLNCAFCRTGKMGFVRNLSSGEILSQLLLLKREMGEYSGKVNIVFMGMGEPFLNYRNVIRALEVMTNGMGIGVSPRNITVSTAGVLDKIKRFEKTFPGIKLGFSLNAPDADLRKTIMPISRKENLAEILTYFRDTPRKHRITFEYVLLGGINDSPAHARALSDLIRGIPCKINIIPFNPGIGIRFKSPDKSAVEAFAGFLCRQKLTVMVRWSKGGEIQSACGQLAVQNNQGNPG